MRSIFLTLTLVGILTGCACTKADNSAAAPSAPVEAAAPAVTDLQPGQALPSPSTRPVIIDFYATWCGPCHAYAPTFDKVAAEYAAKATFVRIDVDKCESLAREYGIQSIPTTIILTTDGKIVRQTGLMPEATLRGMVEDAVK